VTVTLSNYAFMVQYIVSKQSTNGVHIAISVH